MILYIKKSKRTNVHGEIYDTDEQMENIARKKNKITADNYSILTHCAAIQLCRVTITLHFLSSFVRRVTYPKVSPIRLDLAEKNQLKKISKNQFLDQLCNKNFKIGTDSDSPSDDGPPSVFLSKLVKK